MAALMPLGAEDWVDFTTLKKELNLTDGNLGAHLQSLEQAGYIRVNKEFVDRRPRTTLQVTLQGRAAFEAHRAALRAILDG